MSRNRKRKALPPFRRTQKARKLEWLGDAVFEFAFREYMIDCRPEVQFPELGRVSDDIVSNKAMDKVARRLKLRPVGKSGRRYACGLERHLGAICQQEGLDAGNF